MLLPLAGGSGTVIKFGEFIMILELHRPGLKVAAIARQLGVDRKTPAVWSRQPRENGWHRIGRSAQSARPQRRIAWERHLHMLDAMRCSRWSGLPEKMTSTRLI
jgi:hypothetical protein